MLIDKYLNTELLINGLFTKFQPENPILKMTKLNFLKNFRDQTSDNTIKMPTFPLPFFCSIFLIDIISEGLY